MKGYVVVPQFYYYVRTLDELIHGERRNDAVSYEKLFGPIEIPEIHEKKPYCPFGSVVFYIEDDDSLTIVDTQYDSSG